MQTIKHMQSLTLAAGLLTLASCAGTSNTMRAEVPVPAGQNTEIKADILAALYHRNWMVFDENANPIRALYDKHAKHRADIAVHYDNDSYDIKYVSSENLNYQKNNDGTDSIHGAYSRWASYLEDSINVNLKAPGQLMKGAPLSADMYTGEAQIYKLYPGPRRSDEIFVEGQFMAVDGKMMPDRQAKGVYVLRSAPSFTLKGGRTIKSFLVSGKYSNQYTLAHRSTSGGYTTTLGASRILPTDNACSTELPAIYKLQNIDSFTRATANLLACSIVYKNGAQTLPAAMGIAPSRYAQVATKLAACLPPTDKSAFPNHNACVVLALTN